MLRSFVGICLISKLSMIDGISCLKKIMWNVDECVIIRSLEGRLRRSNCCKIWIFFKGYIWKCVIEFWCNVIGIKDDFCIDVYVGR